jgi:hypothetical protein
MLLRPGTSHLTLLNDLDATGELNMANVSADARNFLFLNAENINELI